MATQTQPKLGETAIEIAKLQAVLVSVLEPAETAIEEAA